MANVYRERLPNGYAGYTDGVDVYLDDRLNAEQTLSTLMHELIHVEMGHKGHQPEAVEMQVRYETARRLLPDHGIGRCAGRSLAGVAARLSVTRQVLMDRAATLTDREASRAGCWDCQLCPAIQARAARMVEAC